MQVDDIISEAQVAAEEKINLKSEMNFGSGQNHSVLLRSIPKGAPITDEIDAKTGTLIYEGHDLPKTKGAPDPKTVDQPLAAAKGAWTENGKFFNAAMDFKSGRRAKAELVKIYEKISRGIWSYKGFFELVDTAMVMSDKRKVFKFYLKPVAKGAFLVTEMLSAQLIPTQVKINVWQRDKGKCVTCGSEVNLHFDHEIAFSDGGSSLDEANLRLLCDGHNPEKAS